MKRNYFRRGAFKSNSMLFSLLFNVLTGFGQFDYEKGFIVTNNNDTIYGYVEYGNERLASFSCFFKEDSTSSPQKYSPEELKSIVIGDFRHYVSKELRWSGIMVTIVMWLAANGKRQKRR